jgi:hypothetical protein
MGSGLNSYKQIPAPDSGTQFKNVIRIFKLNNEASD